MCLHQHLLRSSPASDGRPKLHLSFHGISTACCQVVILVHSRSVPARLHPYEPLLYGRLETLALNLLPGNQHSHGSVCVGLGTDELHELRAFAELRGVTCIGEMDVPGHSAAMISALPEAFGFPSAPTLGIANFANQTVIKRLQTLFDEIDTVLPSPFVAIGGDEVSFPAVSHLPEVLEALRSNGLSGVADLYRLFIVEMRSYAVSKNKTLRVWVREDTIFNQYVIIVSLKYDRIYHYWIFT